MRHDELDTSERDDLFGGTNLLVFTFRYRLFVNLEDLLVKLADQENKRRAHR